LDEPFSRKTLLLANALNTLGCLIRVACTLPAWINGRYDGDADGPFYASMAAQLPIGFANALVYCLPAKVKRLYKGVFDTAIGTKGYTTGTFSLWDHRYRPDTFMVRILFFLQTLALFFRFPVCQVVFF